MICPCCKKDNGKFDSIVLTRDGGYEELNKCTICKSYFVEYDEKNDIVNLQVEEHEKQWGDDTVSELREESTYLKNLASLLLEKNNIGANAKALEVGAGRGCLVAALDSLSVQTVGVEPSQKLCDLANAAFSFENSRMFNGTFKEYQLGNSEFYDIAILWHTLEHLEHPIETLVEVGCALKEKGVIAIQTPYPKDSYVYPAHLFFPTVETFKYISEVTGLHLSFVDVDAELAHLTIFLSKNKGKDAKPWKSNDLSLYIDKFNLYFGEFKALNIKINERDEYIKYLESCLDRGLDREKY